MKWSVVRVGASRPRTIVWSARCRRRHIRSRRSHDAACSLNASSRERTSALRFVSCVFVALSARGGTGSSLTWFEAAAAQSLLGAPGKVQEIFVGADSGVSAEDLASQVAAAVPAGAEVITGEKAAEQSQQAVESDRLSDSSKVTMIRPFAL